MSYTKQTWSNGDVITESKLNHMEDGIKANDFDVFPINFYYDENTNEFSCGREWSEIAAEFDAHGYERMIGVFCGCYSCGASASYSHVYQRLESVSLAFWGNLVVNTSSFVLSVITITEEGITCVDTEYTITPNV